MSPKTWRCFSHRAHVNRFWSDLRERRTQVRRGTPEVKFLERAGRDSAGLLLERRREETGRAKGLICLTRVLMFRGNSMHDSSAFPHCGFWSSISHRAEESNANIVWVFFFSLWEYFPVCPVLTQDQDTETQQRLMHCFKLLHLRTGRPLNPNSAEGY